MTREELKHILGDVVYQKIMNAHEKACAIHEETNQKYDKVFSYRVHLDAVFEKAIKYIDKFNVEDYQAILFGASFHDSIEDARLTYNDVMKIAKTYMTNDKAYVATEIVYALTNEKGRNRDERANEKYYEGIRNTPYASFVKICDRMANMEYSFKQKESKTSMYKKYSEELPHFLRALCDHRYPGIDYSYPEQMDADIKKLIETNSQK